MDVGIGAGGSEVVLIPNINLSAHVTDDLIRPTHLGFPCDIPKGTRIAVTGQCSGADATDRLFGIVLYGCD